MLFIFLLSIGCSIASQLDPPKWIPGFDRLEVRYIPAQISSDGRYLVTQEIDQGFSSRGFLTVIDMATGLCPFTMMLSDSRLTVDNMSGPTLQGRSAVAKDANRFVILTRNGTMKWYNTGDVDPYDSISIADLVDSLDEQITWMDLKFVDDTCISIEWYSAFDTTNHVILATPDTEPISYSFAGPSFGILVVPDTHKKIRRLFSALLFEPFSANDTLRNVQRFDRYFWSGSKYLALATEDSSTLINLTDNRVLRTFHGEILGFDEAGNVVLHSDSEVQLRRNSDNVLVSTIPHSFFRPMLRHSRFIIDEDNVLDLRDGSYQVGGSYDAPIKDISHEGLALILDKERHAIILNKNGVEVNELQTLWGPIRGIAQNPIDSSIYVSTFDGWSIDGSEFTSISRVKNDRVLYSVNGRNIQRFLALREFEGRLALEWESVKDEVYDYNFSRGYLFLDRDTIDFGPHVYSNDYKQPFDSIIGIAFSDLGEPIVYSSTKWAVDSCNHNYPMYSTPMFVAGGNDVVVGTDLFDNITCISKQVLPVAPIALSPKLRFGVARQQGAMMLFDLDPPFTVRCAVPTATEYYGARWSNDGQTVYLRSANRFCTMSYSGATSNAESPIDINTWERLSQKLQYSNNGRFATARKPDSILTFDVVTGDVVRLHTAPSWLYQFPFQFGVKGRPARNIKDPILITPIDGRIVAGLANGCLAISDPLETPVVNSVVREGQLDQPSRTITFDEEIVGTPVSKACVYTLMGELLATYTIPNSGRLSISHLHSGRYPLVVMVQRAP